MIVQSFEIAAHISKSIRYWIGSFHRWFSSLQSVSWSLAEFHHNKIVQSPHEKYFNVCRQQKEK